MLLQVSMTDVLPWFSCLCRQIICRRRFSKRFILYLFSIIFLLVLLYLYFASFFLPTITDDSYMYSGTPLDEFIPSDPFQLFWTMWNRYPSTFRGRHLLILESLFIHHPNATVIMLSPTLNDTKLFLPFRHRGYRIYSFNISLRHILQWRWYSNKQTKYFLQHWNVSGIYFYTHLTDYLRTIVLYLYGGTYMDMDALILQPLPYEEFIGNDQTDAGDQCEWCIRNTSGLYLVPAFMRFQPRRRVLRDILELTFNQQAYDASCLNCVGPKAYTENIIRHRDKNDYELIGLKFLEPHRLYPYMWREISLFFHNVEQDTSLELDDLMKRSYSVHLFGHVSDELNIAQGSLIDLLFNRFDLGDLRPKILNQHQSIITIRLIYPSVYIYTHRKRGRFVGRDVIYLRLNETFANDDIRWNITVRVFNGSIIIPSEISLFNLNQAQINIILNKIFYKPFRSTSIDTLMIDVKSKNVSVSCSLTILIFSKWVTVLTKTMGTLDRWFVVQRLAASIERYFPQTTIHIASDSGKEINKVAFLNFMSSNNINGYDLSETVFIHDLPEDSGLSACRNYLVNVVTTPFFFLLDDDFELEEDSHLDILLEMIYSKQHIDIIAGKILEDIRDFNDFSGIFLRYNYTLELVHDASNDDNDKILFPRSSKKQMNDLDSCRQVDFVPNVFMGRTKAVRDVRWDDVFKIGEHEDFFFRFGQANRTVYSCRYIHVHHRQMKWWQKTDISYFAKRTRVYKYFEQMLIKHNLKRLITFNNVMVDLERNVSES